MSTSASLDVAAGRDPFDGSTTSFISMSCVSTMIFLVDEELVVEKNLDDRSKVLKHDLEHRREECKRAQEKADPTT